MKRINFLPCLLAMFALAIFVSGCSNEQKPAASPGSQAGAGNGQAHEEGDHDGHDHAEGEHEGHDHAEGEHDGHDHAEGDHDGHDHSAEHEGPHGGHVIELGLNHQYHAELVENEDAHAVTVYMLDKDMKELTIDQATITMNLMVDGKAQSYELAAAGVAGGKASQFNAADKSLFEALHEHEASGKLRVTIDGTPYSGEVEHHHHEGHDEHDGHDH